jgi:hypothetical protein
VLLRTPVGCRPLEARQLALEEPKILELGAASFAGIQMGSAKVQPGTRELAVRVRLQLRLGKMSDWLFDRGGWYGRLGAPLQVHV